MSNLQSNLSNLDTITKDSDIQLRTGVNKQEEVFNRTGCFSEEELVQIRKDSLLPIDQVPSSRIRKILNRFAESQALNCSVTASDADAISKFFCLNQEEIEALRRDSKKLPDTLSSQRIEEILRRLSQARENRCEISVLDFEIMKKFVFLLEVEISLRRNQCFSAQLFNDLIRFATEETQRFTDPELNLLIRSITRNTAIQTRNPDAKNCRMSADQKQYYTNLLTSLKLERERRLAAGVPKGVSERTRLDLLSEEATIINELNETNKKLPNMTLNQISINASQTILGILDDLLSPDPNKNTVDNWIEAFTKESRPIYIGLFFIVVAIFIGLFKNVS